MDDAVIPAPGSRPGDERESMGFTRLPLARG